MDAALDWARTAIDEDPIYWAGVGIWVLGFAIYLPATVGRGRTDLIRFATALCWLGFLITAAAHFASREVTAGRSIEWPELTATFWKSTHGFIWLLWVLGSLAILASWLGLLAPRAGWLGLCAAMTGVIASWPQQEQTQLLVLSAGAAVVILLALVSLNRGELWPRANDPGDYEAELVRLCNGSRRMARKLVRTELKRSPTLTRAGAALAVVTRLRHERGPYRPGL